MINLKVKDHSVSKETFTLVENKTYGFLKTHPQPEVKSLSKYYESENYISHTNSKRNVFEKAYHLVRQITIKQKINIIKSNQNTSRKKILDVGCGTGYFLKACLNEKWDVTGIEPNEEARKLACQLTQTTILNSEDLFLLNTSSFDVITLWHVLEHLPDLEKHVAQFKKLLKPNGVLIIALPNYNSYDAKFYKEFWAAYDVPRHLWHFNRESVNRLMHSFELNVESIKPMWFDAFYVSMLSENYKNGVSNILKAFGVALWSNLKSCRTKEVSSLIYVIKHD